MGVEAKEVVNVGAFTSGPKGVPGVSPELGIAESSAVSGTPFFLSVRLR